MARLPNFLNRLGSTPAPPSAGPMGGAPPGAQKLACVMQKQPQTQWCWAAVSTSISIFYTPASTWTQCKVANQAFNRTDCCGSGGSGPCNQPWYLDRALAIVGAFKNIVGMLPFTNTQGEINAKRPLCIRVGWNSGGGHFLAIIGWLITSNGGEYYDIDDPIYGPQTLTRIALESSYRGNGAWTHSYYTLPPGAGSGTSGTFGQPPLGFNSIGP